jgi:Flp pilus assembly protein TadG
MVMTMGPLLKRIREHRGAAIIEVALTLPLLLLVSVGIFEFGRAYQTWQVLTNAAREGARVAVLPGSTDSSVRTRVVNYMETGQLPEATRASIDITRDNAIDLGGAGSSTGSQVTVRYPFSFIVLQPVARLVVPGGSLGSPIVMAASAMMRNE